MATSTTTDAPVRRRRARAPMKLRNIRTSDELWADFGELCDHEGTELSADLRAYMEKRLARARRQGWRPSREG